LLLAGQDGGKNSAEAEDCFHKAMETARRQGAKMFELHAATGLSRLYERQGRREEARRMLEEIYGWFSESFDAPDLREAKALLDVLKDEYGR
jgi:adenylate cyclase